MEIIKPLITQIDRAETLRYAGLSRDKTWQPELLDKACMQLLSTAEPQFVYRIATHHEQVIDGKYCYSSQALQRHLRQSKQVVLLAGTLGQAVDELGDRLFAAGEYTTAVLANAAATALIEQAADYAQQLITKLYLHKRGLRLGSRFSPGYADWPLTEQREFFALLATDKIRLSLHESLSLVPKKSITAVIPILTGTCDDISEGCRNCSARQCEYRK